MNRLHNSGPSFIRLALAAFSALLLVSSAAPAKGGYDHSRFDKLLSRAVASDRISYSTFRNNTDFDAYLADLAKASIGSLSRDEQLAFWINAYNALVIRNVLDNPGMKKPTDVKGFFDAKKFTVAGRSLTLNQIENEIIRPTFNEPLIHFGLVCAARSCPPILPKAYTGRSVRSQLAKNAKSYLASGQNRIDTKTKTLHLSKIFEWYKEDFGGGDAGLRAFVQKYGTSTMQKELAANRNYNIRFIEYDWTLNSR